MSCINPLFITPKGWPRNSRVFVNCSKCMPCRIERRTGWQLRFALERKMKHPLCMVTLTFDDRHMRLLDRESFLLHGTISCDPAHVQKFFKRLRRIYEYEHSKKIKVDGKIKTIRRNLYLKYFYCAEYGEDNGRLHYHLIISGLGPGNRDLIDRAWQQGFVSVLPVLAGGLSYVLDYLDDVSSDPDYNAARYGALRPPVSAFSQRIGADYYEEHREQIIKDGGIKIGFGQVVPLPSYYRHKIGCELTIQQRINMFYKDPVRHRALQNAVVFARHYSDKFDFSMWLSDYVWKCEHSGQTLFPEMQAVYDKFSEKFQSEVRRLNHTDVRLCATLSKKRRMRGRSVVTGSHPSIVQNMLVWSRSNEHGKYNRAVVSARDLMLQEAYS